MFASLAALTIALNASPSIAPSGSVADAQYASEAVVTPGACPIDMWGGRCAPMTPVQRQSVRTAVVAHARLDSARCQSIHDLLVTLLSNDYSQVWTFEQHQYDTRTSYVMGQAVRAPTGEVKGFGMRLATMRSTGRRLATAALHEAAHLNGEDEAGATWAERNCVA